MTTSLAVFGTPITKIRVIPPEPPVQEYGPLTIIDKNGFSINITPPDFGYETIIHLNKKLVKGTNKYYLFDYGSGYDWREVKNVIFTLNNYSANLFSEMFLNTVQAREKTVDLILDRNSGIFLFGPDFGDM